jgi:predicted deacylase
MFKRKNISADRGTSSVIKSFGRKPSALFIFLAQLSALTRLYLRLVRPLIAVLLLGMWALCAQAQDRIEGVPVIETLKPEALAAGARYNFYFRAGDQSTGQGWYIPVIVIKGAKPGPRLLLSAAVHGDELNGMKVIHTLAQTLDPKTLSGTIIALPAVNTPGLLFDNRNFLGSSDGGTASNLNRLMPGNAKGDEAAVIYAGRIWDAIIKGNVDFAVDIHTQSRGTLYPLFIFVDPRQPLSLNMAKLMNPDMIKYDPGLKGTLETALNEAGIPAITAELGGPKVFDAEMVARGVAGVRNILIDQKMLAGVLQTPKTPPIIGNQMVSLRAPLGGIADILVKLGEPVRQGQLVAIINSPFGEERVRIVAPQDGHVLSVGTDPLREPGALLVRLLTNSSDPSCKNGC